MSYTVKKLAQLSGVSVRALHFYDEVGLLKPAYYGDNGYRYYEEEQLLILQQILFYRELGFELKQIQKVLGRSDFNKIAALSSHRKILEKDLAKTRQLIKTIDNTIEHLKGTKKMKEKDMYSGFSKEKQAEYEKQLIDRFGDKVKLSFEECRQNVKDWTKSDWEKSKEECTEICKDLTKLIENHAEANSKEAQSLIRRHFNWLKQFWTPTKETYPQHGQLIVETELRKAYEAYHKKLPEYIADGISVFSENELI